MSVRIIRAAASDGDECRPSHQPPLVLPREAPASEPVSRVKRVLNCGSGNRGESGLHAIFRGAEWQETRLDIDPSVRPDIVGSIIDMTGSVATASIDAIWCSHNLEHLYEDDVDAALTEFRRVLRSDGFILVTSPDLDEVARFVLDKGLDAVAYISPAGPIRGIDMIYGYGTAIRAGNKFMAHRTGFSVETLGRTIGTAGFPEVRVAKGPGYSLWALGYTQNADRDAISRLLSATPERFLIEDTD